MGGTLTLIIDGNNLIYHLYQLSAEEKVTKLHVEWLMDHLGIYARSWEDADLAFEICLDWYPEGIKAYDEAVRLIAAKYPLTADDEVMQRLWFHAYSGSRCLVVTNDEEIQAEVTSAGGTFVPVYQFVRLPSKERPIFLPPDEFPPIRVPNLTLEKELSRHHWGSSVFLCKVNLARQHSAGKRKPGSKEKPQRESFKEGRRFPNVPRFSQDTIEHLSTDAPKSTPGSFLYRLNLDHWPLEQGARFLLDSFCADHQEEYRSLMQDFELSNLRPADLRVLADFLLTACGDEPDFARRGSLMDRVRLALLKEKGQPIPLARLAELVGIKPAGLQGRIKLKAKSWIEIIPV